MRCGISLLEVLISIGVLAVGLLSVLMIIPLGQITVAQADQADRAAACGRAVMRNMKIRRTLDYRYWYWESGTWGLAASGGVAPSPIPEPDGNMIENASPVEATGTFFIDPLGRSVDPTGKSTLYNNNLPSIVFATPQNVIPRRTISVAKCNIPGRGFVPGVEYFWNDEIVLEKNPDTTERPFINPGTPANPVGLDNSRTANYTYFFSVCPASNERGNPIKGRLCFDVSAIVFYQRNFAKGANGCSLGEWMANVVSFPGMGVAGGAVQLQAKNVPGNYTLDAFRYGGNYGNPQRIDSSTTRSGIKENQWVMLYDTASGLSSWYEVVNSNLDIDSTINPVTNPSNAPTVTLKGPDWKPNTTTILYVVDGAIGCYQSIVNLDRDKLWNSND
jgi:type II secretory pathway pseudopilin PulG